jgi:hypothetical protein
MRIKLMKADLFGYKLKLKVQLYVKVLNPIMNFKLIPGLWMQILIMYCLITLSTR